MIIYITVFSSFSPTAITFFLFAKIFLLLEEFFSCCENCSLVVRIFLQIFPKILFPQRIVFYGRLYHSMVDCKAYFQCCNEGLFSLKDILNDSLTSTNQMKDCFVCLCRTQVFRVCENFYAFSKGKFFFVKFIRSCSQVISNISNNLFFFFPKFWSDLLFLVLLHLTV